MSPGVLRLVFVLCGLYVLIVRTFMPLWSIPFVRSHDDLPFFVLFGLAGLGQLVVTALPFPVFGWLWWRNRPRATFALRDAGFEVPAAIVNFAAPLVVIALMSTPGLLIVEGVPGRAEARFAIDPVSLVVSLLADALLAGIVVTYLALSGRPRVRLTPAGVAIRTLRQREYAWEDFVPGSPLRVEPKRIWILRFPLRRVNEHGVLWTATVHAHLLHVRPEFLAAATREYADHPERRAAIGTPEELDRLRRAAPGRHPSPEDSHGPADRRYPAFVTLIDLGDHEEFAPEPAPPRPDLRRYAVAAVLVAAALFASASEPAAGAPSVRAVGPVSSDQQSLLVGDTALGLDLTGETLSAYDAAGGGKLWAMQLDGRLTDLRGGPGVAVVATDAVIRIGTGTDPEPGGIVRWDPGDPSVHLRFAPQVRGYDARTGAEVWARAGELLGGGELFVVEADGQLTAVDPATGAARWTRAVGADAAALSTPDGVLLLAADGTVSALSAADGTARTLGRVHPGAEGLYAFHSILATLEHRASGDMMVLYDLRTFAVEHELPAQDGYGVWDCSGQLCLQSGGRSARVTSGGAAFVAISPDAIAAGGAATAPGTLPTGIADGWAEIGTYAGHRLALLGVPGGRTSWLGVATGRRFTALLPLNAPARRCDIGEKWLLCLGQTKAVAIRLSELDTTLRRYARGE